MLDNQGRITLPKYILERQDEIHPKQEVLLFLDRNNNEILIRSKDNRIENNLHFIRNAKIDDKGRVFVPKAILKIFSTANFLPTEKNGKIYILIIEHAKKSE